MVAGPTGSRRAAGTPDAARLIRADADATTSIARPAIKKTGRPFGRPASIETRSRASAQRGSSECPIKYASTERAHWRPSRIAHTTSDWPRRMSPAANTLSTDV